MRALLIVAVVCAASLTRGQWLTQTLDLPEGWSGVHLTVQPVDDACVDVFAGKPILSVTWWCRDASILGDGSPPGPQTRIWFPKDPGASTFFRMMGGQSYLIETSAATTVPVKGVPSLPASQLWLGQANLVGMHVPPGQNVFLSEYFEFFGHLATSNPYARVPRDGTPTTVQGNYRPQPLQALWVTTQGEGTAEYSGPFNLSIDGPGSVLNFAGVVSPRTLRIRNNAGSTRTLRIATLASETPPAGQGSLAGPVPLLRGTLDWSHGYPREQFDPWVLPWTTTLEAHETLELRLLPDLASMPPAAGAYQHLLLISDQGSSDNDPSLTQGRCRYRIGVRADGDLAAQEQPIGLWVGHVVLNEVNRARMLSGVEGVWDPEALHPTGREFTFRLVLHVDAYGVTRLLKEVFAATAPQGSPNEGNALLPSRQTAEDFLALNPGATIRRISSANFPFIEPLSLEGPGFAVADATLTGEITLPFDDRVNPFVHAFHPDHDNLEFRNSLRIEKTDGADGHGDYESWSVAREIGLTFAAGDPLGPNVSWNLSETGGTYSEIVTGLNKTEIRTAGIFRLAKVSDVDTLWTVSAPD